MNIRKPLTTVAALGLLAVAFALPNEVDAQRKYYGSYSQKYNAGAYSYRYYNYYSPKYGQYKKHMAVYYPSRPKYVYYYNPYTKKYWGRYDVTTGGYSLLPNHLKKERLNEISESDFPPEGQMPPPEPGIDDPMLPPPESVGPSNPTTPPSFPTPPSSGGGCKKGY